MLIRKLNLPNELGTNSSCLLFGARGVGKSQLCREFLATVQSEKIWTVHTYDLLHSDTFERFLKRPQMFRLEVEEQLKQSKALFVFVDEVQKIPELLNEAHSLYETYRGKVRFLLTGSSARKLRKSGVNLLAGRALNLKLHPFIISELVQPLPRQLRLGSLPGVIIDNEFPEQTLRTYVSSYLKEEIQQEALVRKLDSFARFLEVAVQYHGSVINATTIADYAGVTSQTIADYISILEDTLIAFQVHGWSASSTKQLRTTPKLYFFDNGVANALRGELSVEMVESSSRFGTFFEAFVIQECIRWNDYNHLDLKFSYWRTNNDIEVELIISRGAGRPLAAIEIKSTKHPEAKHLGGLMRFAEDYPNAKLYCISGAEHPYSLEGVQIVPYKQLQELLSTIAGL